VKKIIISTLLLMGLAFANEAYKPKFDKVSVAGSEIYVLADDVEEALEDGMVDQFWLAELINNNKPLPKGVTLVDLREDYKYKAQHIKGAINLPFDMKSEKMDFSKIPADGVVIFYCDKGVKSMTARTKLDEKLASRVFAFDATFKCDENNTNCTLTPNEAI